jgi:hypothetical protein
MINDDDDLITIVIHNSFLSPSIYLTIALAFSLRFSLFFFSLTLFSLSLSLSCFTFSSLLRILSIIHRCIVIEAPPGMGDGMDMTGDGDGNNPYNRIDFTVITLTTVITQCPSKFQRPGGPGGPLLGPP